MINHDAIRLLDYYLQHSPESFSGDEDTFATNIEISTLLRDEFRKGDITKNHLFQWVFTTFYRMNFVPKEKRAQFFAKMESLREAHSDLDARQITEDLKPVMGKYYFSFVTKMLNLLDDTLYPIYDGQVCIVFQKPFTPEETTLDHQVLIYQDIIDTYRYLESHPVIDLFRTHFHCPQIGYMKILDTIYWRLGKVMEANAEDFPWQ